LRLFRKTSLGGRAFCRFRAPQQSDRLLLFLFLEFLFVARGKRDVGRQRTGRHAAG
jgi:hypothetical protein